MVMMTTRFCQSSPSEVYPATSNSRYHCRHDSALWQTWGWGCERYGELFTLQDGACAGCGRPRRPGQKRLSIDHNHETIGPWPRGFIRGLLCGGCNDLLTVGVVAVIVRRNEPGELRLSGGEVISARLVAYVLDPPGLRLNLVTPEPLLARIEAKAAAAAARQPKTRGRRRTSRPQPAPPPTDDFDVDPDDRWADWPRRKTKRSRLEARPTAQAPRPSAPSGHLAALLRGNCDCADCVARREFQAGWERAAKPIAEAEESTAPTPWWRRRRGRETA